MNGLIKTGNDMNEQKVNFQYNSLIDIQNTIRSIDIKISFLLLIILFPLSNLESFIKTMINLYPTNLCYKILYFCYFFLFSLSWVLSFICSIKSLVAIDNPTNHIIDNKKYKGLFYIPNLYSINFFDSIMNRDSIKSLSSIENENKKLPEDFSELSKELTFEQMKLAYIRDIKIIRQKWAFNFALFWILLGALLIIKIFFSRI